MSRKKKSSGEELFKKIKAAQDKRKDIQLRHQRDREPNLLQISQALDEYYFLEKLRTYCGYLSYQIMVNDALIDYNRNDFLLLPYIQTIVAAGSAWHPAVLIYYHIGKLFDLLGVDEDAIAAEKATFTAIETLLKDNRPNLPVVDLIEIHSYLTNYSTYMINHGREDYLMKNIVHNQRLIDLYERSEQPYVISAGVYKNMVSLILRTAHSGDPELAVWLRDHQHENIWEWAHHFIELYKEKLPETAREKYYSYCKALVYFRKGAYTKAFQWIRGLDRVRELFINFDIKVLRLQVLLELDILDDGLLETEQITMEDEIEGLRSMLKYDKHSSPKLAYQSAYFQEFLNLFRKFYSFYNKNAWMYRFGDAVYHQKREALLEELQACAYPYREWFLEKLEAIK